MISCPRCGHQNLPGYPNCSKCGSLLPGAAATPDMPSGAGGMGPTGPLLGGGAGGPSPQEEYVRLMAQRAASQKRNRVIYGVVLIAVIGVVGARLAQDRAKKSAIQAKLDYAEKWVELEKRETGSFWNCVMASEVDVGMFATGDQIRARIESAYFTQQKKFSDYLLTECVPKIDRARQAFGGLKDPPVELVGALDKYKGSLPKLQSGLEDYAEKIKNRKEIKSVDDLIQELGNAWHGSPASPIPESVAYEKFMQCAIPGLGAMKDTQAMLEFMHEACFKKDPVAFMDRVRKDCGPILQTLDPKATPSKTFRASAQRFFEQDARQLQAWESCGKRSRKGKKQEDIEVFMLAVNEYMTARNDVVKAAREIKSAGP